jgi:hypothetical protein
VTDIPGVVLIFAGSALGVVTSFALWRRLPASVVVVLAAASGATVGTGALMVQTDATAVDWAVTLAVLGVISPVHSRLLFGRPGART